MSRTAHISSPKAHGRKLDQAEGYAAYLIHYPPHTRQPRHYHSTSQLSFLLAGSFVEECAGRVFRPVGPSVGVMPAGEGHAVRFGQEGALLLSVDCADSAGFGERRRDWRRMDDGFARKAAMLGTGLAPITDLAVELIAQFTDTCADATLPLRDGPSWLRRSIQRILVEPEVTIAALAREAGVHRVHFSRIFQRYTGLSPTEFRLARKCSAAMHHTIAGGGTIADAAAAAGFADQAHWARACRALSGLPPGRIRQFFSA